MVNGILKRLFPLLCCIVILISCMVVPASAISNTVNPENSMEPKVAVYLTGSCFYTTARSYDDEEHFGTSFGLPDVSRSTNNEEMLSSGAIVLNRGALADAAVEWNLYQYVRTQETYVENVPKWRLHERYRLVNDDGGAEIWPWSVTFSFDSFGGSWNKEFLRTLFYLHGRYEFVVEFTAFSVHENRLLSSYVTYEGSSNGAQSVLFGAQLDKVANELQLSEGDPFYFSGFRVIIPWGREDQELTISRACVLVPAFASSPSGDPTSVYIDYPVRLESLKDNWPVVNKSLYWFLESNGLVTGPSQSFLEGGDVTEFLAGAASGVLDAPLFGNFTLGGILGMLIAICVVFWLLKYFAGG